MINKTNDLVNFGNGLLIDYVKDLIQYQFPEDSNIEHYIIPTILNTKEKVFKLCFRVIKNTTNTTQVMVTVTVSPEKNIMIFTVTDYVKEPFKKSSRSISLSKIKNLDDIFNTLFENIIIAEKD